MLRIKRLREKENAMKKLLKIYNGLASFIGHCILAFTIAGALFVGYIAILDWRHTRKERKMERHFDEHYDIYDDPDLFGLDEEDGFEDEI
jgi:hypothetical protein